MATPGALILDSLGNPLANTTNTAQAAQAGNATIKSTPGRLFAVTVTTTGTTPLVVNDGPTGATIFQLAASPALGTYPVGVNGNAFLTSLVVIGSATNPAIVLHWA